MRTVNFRDDVLHVVADKMGLDPEQSNFLSNQAIPIGKSINQWVRRLYDARDWPEWTVTHQFSVSTDHLVAWDASATDLFTPNTSGTLVKIGRVLKVFLVNPDTTDAPVDTPFTLTDEGIHVGYEHGSSVWIRYLPLPPVFTAIPWTSEITYQQDDVVYSYTTGESYRSRIYNNRGNNPAALVGSTNLVAEVMVPYDPGDEGVPVTLPEIWAVVVNSYNFYALIDATFSITLLETFTGSVITHTFSYTTTNSGLTVNNVMDGLIAGAAFGDPWLATVVFSKDVPNAKLIINLATAGFNVSEATASIPIDIVTTGDPIDPTEPVLGDDNLVVLP